jgi:SAM-dependent methyltransferase
MTHPAIWAPEHAAAFDDPEVAQLYRHRPPYANGAIDFIAELVDPSCPRVLDLGAGTGNVARLLADRVAAVDAVEPSPSMIAAGRELPDGAHPHLQWIPGTAEAAPLRPPYGLATAGASMHWMDWDVVVPRIARALTPPAHLVLLDIVDAWAADERFIDVIARYSMYRGSWQKHVLVDELTQRGLFRKTGARTFREPVRQRAADYVSSFHAHSSLTIARIGAEQARAFDEEIAALLRPDDEGFVTRDASTELTWGTALR